MEDTPARTSEQALLVAHPHAIVSGVSADGLFVGVPASITLTGHRRARARSALDLVEREDRPLVRAAWDQVLDEGAASCRVRLVGAAGATGELHLLDVRAEHGCYLAVLAPDLADDDHPREVAQILSSPPRLMASRLDQAGVYLEVRPEVTAVLGWDPSELVGQLSLERIHPEDHELVVDAWMELLSRPGETTRSRFRHAHLDGTWRWVEATNHNLLDGAEGGHVRCELLDISEEMRAVDALQASEQILRRLAAALPVGVVHLDGAGSVIYANDRLHQLLGTRPGDDLRHLTGRVALATALAAAIAAVLDGEDVDVELDVGSADGRTSRCCALTLRALSAPDGAQRAGAIGCLTDITDDRRLRDELERRAAIDTMTSCANRSATIDFLSTQLAGGPVSTIYIDLDRFKGVNDRYGHATGDDLLVVVAGRLRSAIREVDLVGRLGGDEFLLVCPGVDEGEAMAVADRVHRALCVPFSLGLHTVTAGASVGVASSLDGEDAHTLIARADGAMYRSKQDGGRRPVAAVERPLQREPSGERSR